MLNCQKGRVNVASGHPQCFDCRPAMLVPGLALGNVNRRICVYLYSIFYISAIYIYHIDMVEYTSGFIIHIIYIYHIDSLYICIYISYKSHTVYI